MNKAVFLAGALMLGAIACDDPTAPISRPINLWYQLEPSGVILHWDPVLDANLEVYNVYGRLDGSSVYDLRGTTTSPSFHDEGQPDLEYRVTAVSVEGVESDFSEEVIIDERLRLESPAAIWTVSLDGAILVAWDDNAFINEPDGFKNYRVYSTGYDLDADLCDEVWTLEGTTVSPEFLVSVLTNGVPLCFGVSAESIEGWESMWSALIADTPRPEARNVLLTPQQVDLAFSGFRFFEDTNVDGFADDNELGLIRAGNRPDIDFVIDLSAPDVFIQPVRTGVEVALYPGGLVDDLTSITVAPVGGYSPVAITAEPGFGYVFEIDEGDGFFRYGAIRVTHVGQQFIIFDWSYQTDPGNPELSIRGGLPASDKGGLIVKGHK
jgi:hypothetical protein